MLNLVDLGLKFNPKISEADLQRLDALDKWDFSSLVNSMNPRLLMSEGRVFSVEQIIPILLHFSQYDESIKEITKSFMLSFLDNGMSYNLSQSEDIDTLCFKVKEIVEEIVIEFKRFVAISIIDPSTVQAPPGPVDMFWHFFILHTVEYKKFCEDVWHSHDFDKHL